MIDRLIVKYRDRKVGELSLSPDNRLCVFEYDKEWLVAGFSISPLELPLKSGIFIAKPGPFNGGFGIFEDSLPDGYGRYLLHKALAREGINDADLSTLDRLSFVGDGGMGALAYSPITSIGSEITIKDFDMLQAKALEVLREKQDDDADLLLFNSGNSGGARPKAVFQDDEGHWLVKFRHTYDPVDIGVQEFHYNEAARACGLNVPDFKLVNGRYFATRRFDIAANGHRIHTATAGGLLSVSLQTPVLDYENLLALTGFLTQDVHDVEEMFRRMVFNYLTDNKDDHCKNFSFIVEDDGSGKTRWKLAPAYDLTRCAAGYNGEHATSVNGKGRPRISDFLTVGTRIRINKGRCEEIIDQVRGACRDIICYEIE
ncbi:MAG: type II toxin-antitoxin system HipA family toxin [Duncaniella sp.]|nr:type II toxin-antitoxin system HipA family toxin [Duncaniella sp.]